MENQESSFDWNGLFKTAVQAVGEGTQSYFGAQAASKNAQAQQAQTTAAAQQAAQDQKMYWIAGGVGVFALIVVLMIAKRK